MAFRPLVLFIAVSLGGWCGWFLGSSAGLMTAYLTGVLGASIGLYFGRRLLRYLDD